MALPEQVRVKLSSEAAEYVALTPVVVQELPFRELLEHIAAVARKEPARVKEILKRGTLVCGGSRFRWGGVDLEWDDVRTALAMLPDPDPERPFDERRCVRVVLAGAGVKVAVQREAGLKRRLFQNRSFWEALVEHVPAPSYSDYSYRDRADVYRSRLTEPQREAIREAADLLKYSELAGRLRVSRVESVEWLLPR